jgi:hypothetical protein
MLYKIKLLKAEVKFHICSAEGLRKFQDRLVHEQICMHYWHTTRNGSACYHLWIYQQDAMKFIRIGRLGRGSMNTDN